MFRIGLPGRIQRNRISLHFGLRAHAVSMAPSAALMASAVAAFAFPMHMVFVDARRLRQNVVGANPSHALRIPIVVRAAGFSV